MTRLTDDYGDLKACDGCMYETDDDSCGSAFRCEHLIQALDLLSEYESTGLTPDEIKAIVDKKGGTRHE